MLNDADDAFLARLLDGLPPDTLRADTAPWLTEPRGRWHGRGVVLSPRTTSEVAAIVRACAEARVPVVPYGGGTGLVGGQLAEDGPVPVVLSLDRMTRIGPVDRREPVLEVEAGAILADIKARAAEAGLLFPLSLGSQGTARIGGLLATNAGGVNVLRYGNARAQCLGLEVVTATGEIWDGRSRLMKDNTGYDLRDLYIGSEGTLGIITGATLRLWPRPQATGTALIQVASPEAALDLLALLRDAVGEAVSAFELIHRQGFDFLEETGIAHARPLDPVPDWCVLTEVGLSGGGDPAAVLEEVFARGAEAELCEDGTIARSEAQAAELWHIREAIPEANRKIGSVSSHDISVPVARVPEFIARAPAVLEPIGRYRINCFGHLGDGNLHWNVFPMPGETRADHENRRDAIKRAVHDLVHEMGGSVSAEHGIGRLKVEDLERYAGPVKLGLLRAIKSALDPAGIMNPGAVLRA